MLELELELLRDALDYPDADVRERVRALVAERRPQRRRRRRLAIALAVPAIAVVVTASALAVTGHLWGLSSSSPVPYHRLSRLDRAIVTSSRLFGPRGAHVVRIGARDGIVFYELAHADGNRCYAAGRVGEKNLFDMLACPAPDETFPSREQPVFDLSVFELTPTPSGNGKIVRLSGLAADAVRSVGLIGDDGTLYRTPVVDNVYSTDDLPRVPVRALVAFDADGKQVYVQCLARAGCG
jgi:hypothetical protein